jgi:hypothetical protein
MCYLAGWLEHWPVWRTFYGPTGKSGLTCWEGKLSLITDLSWRGCVYVIDISRGLRRLVFT